MSSQPASSQSTVEFWIIFWERRRANTLILWQMMQRSQLTAANGKLFGDMTRTFGHDKARSINEAKDLGRLESDDGTIPMIIFIGDSVSDLPAEG
jgi:hypothetical protein